MTIKEFLEEITKVFRKSGVACPENEAVLLACHVLSVDRSYLLLHRDEYIDEKILLASAALINERCAGRPLAYILGTANFYGLDITVDERVLIPRPETELIAEEAIHCGKTAPRVLDLCTGSGCIAAAIAANLPEAQITASDVSLKAFQLARYNCRPYGNITVVRSDLFEKLEGPFDVIVTNPPYIAEKDRSWMQREVKDHEPEMALFAGEDGLDIIRRILAEAGNYLAEDGLLLMEIGEKQTEEVLRLAAESGQFKEIAVKKDLAGLDRYLKARKK